MEMSASFSVGAVAYRHDIREGELPKNVDPSLTKYNITFTDKLQGRSIEQYTNERMQGAVDAYNSKQKRADRKIKNYVDWHKKNGPQNKETRERTPLMYEAVFQIGEHASLGKMWYGSQNKSMQFRHFMQKECEAILKEMRDHYPHLEIVWATLHMDEPEGTPHLHIGYQPIGDCYKQGLLERVCLGNALGCDGIERIKNRGEADEEGFQQRRFYNRMEEYVKSRLSTKEMEQWMGEEIIIKERVSGRAHLDPDTYKRRKNAEEEAEKWRAAADNAKSELIQTKADLDSVFDQLAEEKEKVVALQSDRRTLEQDNDDLKQENVALKQENADLIGKNSALKQENVDLREENAKGHRIIDAMERKYHKLEDNLTNMTAQYEETKKLWEKINDALLQIIPRWIKAYAAVQRRLEHWFKTEMQVYKEICKQTDPIILKGQTAYKTIEDTHKEVIFGKESPDDLISAIDDLASATDELENIADGDVERD